MGSAATNYGWITVTANGENEPATATADTATEPYILNPAANAGKSSYTIKMYSQATVDPTKLLDTKVVNVIFKAGSVIDAVLTNDSHNIPTDSAGANPSFANSGTDIYVYEGATELVYDGQGTTSGTWTVSKSNVNVTSGSITDQGTFARVGVLTAIGDETGKIDFTITGKSLAGNAFTIVKSQTFTKARGGVPGTSPLIYEIVTSAPVITKEAPNAATNGTHSSITIQGKKYDGSTTTNYGWVTVTANGVAEVAIYSCAKYRRR